MLDLGQEEKKEEAKMEVKNLYREEIYTDREIGNIRVFVPVTPEGEKDTTRPAIYTGETHILTQLGTLPISFEIDAANLTEACEKYQDAAKAGIEKTMKELQELRRQAANKIVMPGEAGFTPPVGGSGLVTP